MNSRASSRNSSPAERVTVSKAGSESPGARLMDMDSGTWCTPRDPVEGTQSEEVWAAVVQTCLSR